MIDNPFVRGERLYLRALSENDCNDDYLGWLNDAEVLRYRGAKAFPQNFASMRKFVTSVRQSDDLHLAICLQDGDRHIGNISLNAVDWLHASAELSIMLGARDCWGKGYAKEAITILIGHGFRNMRLNRVWAESPNPAFNAAVRSLGWTREGVRRQAFLLDGGFVDLECYSILKEEFGRQ